MHPILRDIQDEIMAMTPPPPRPQVGPRRIVSPEEVRRAHELTTRIIEAMAEESFRRMMRYSAGPLED